MPIRALAVFGTRPEAIKMAPVVRALQAAKGFSCRVCVSAQHRDMLDQVLELFDLRPDHDLDVQRPRQDLAELTARILSALAPVLAQEAPDVVLVQGDTTTALAAALAAFYARIPVAHVEAGLRTGRLDEPFPEEANRVLTDRLSRFLFAPTAGARDRLLAEGADPAWIWVTGNTVIDALLAVRERVRQESVERYRAAFGSAFDAVAQASSPLVLITAHRRESFGPGLRRIGQAIARLAAAHPEVDWVYPLHLNPNVQEPMRELLAGRPNVHLLAPLDYAAFVRLMDRASFILTDSGGIQEEAPSLGKPVLVMRERTERPEGVAAGTVRLAGTEIEPLIAAAQELLTGGELYTAMSRAHNPFGDGHAAGRIVEALASRLSTSPSPTSPSSASQSSSERPGER